MIEEIKQTFLFTPFTVSRKYLYIVTSLGRGGRGGQCFDLITRGLLNVTAYIIVRQNKV